MGNYSPNSRIKENEKKNPSFKSFGLWALRAAGTVTQGIENKGYWISFLIQDGLGMTLPRTGTGFMRDKEVTGEYNIQEGTEVFLREGLTGPLMIGVAPAVLWLTRKKCLSTNTNTMLIKRMGENLKNLVKSPAFDKSLRNDSQKFKNEFYRYSIDKAYRATVPNDKNADATIKYLLTEFNKFDSKDKKTSEAAYKDMLAYLNEKLVENSTELDDLCKLKVGDGKEQRLFVASDVLKAIKDFANDAITNNKNAASIDEKAAENIKNNFATKRLLTNVANIAATLGIMSIIPKIYARSDVAPGAKHLLEAQQKQTDSEKNIAFKGKGINNNGFFAKIGKFLTKSVPEWFQREFEYSGFNFSPALFACLSLFGLLLPRGLRAYDRALVDDKGRKDMSEVNEILLRDTTSSLSVVFAVPILTKLFVNAYENKQGFILTNKASEGKGKFKKAIDLLNPFSPLKVFTNTELEALYGNINTKEKMMNFCKYVDSKGGDLEKIISKSDNAHLMTDSSGFKLKDLKGLERADKNKRIISFVEKLEGNKGNELLTKIMKGTPNHNKIATVARGLNSIPGVISTFVISPVILGYFIPKLTYFNTRKSHAKMLEEMNGQKERA